MFFIMLSLRTYQNGGGDGGHAARVAQNGRSQGGSAQANGPGGVSPQGRHLVKMLIKDFLD